MRIETMPDPAVEKAHTHSIRNEPELRASAQCGCFHCLALFPPAAIADWITEAPTRGGRPRTALCPHCGIDSVIGSASQFPIEHAFLERMQAYWFSADCPPDLGNA